MEENNSKRGQLKVIVLLLIGFIIGFATHAFIVSKESVLLDDKNNASEEELIDTDLKSDEDGDEQEVLPTDKLEENKENVDLKPTNPITDETPKIPFNATPNNSSDSGYSFSVADQSAGGVVYVSNLTFPKESWIAVREDRNGELGNILGAAWYPAGTHAGSVSLLRDTKVGQIYYTVIYFDDGDKKFDHEKDTLLIDNEGNVPASMFRTY